MYVNESRELESKLNPSFLHAFNARKRQSWNIYFRLLGYSGLLAARGNEIHKEMDSLRLKQMQEAYRKLFCHTKNREREFSYWRLGKFKEIRSEDQRKIDQPVGSSCTVYRLFSSEKRCLMFQKIQKFESSHIDKMSVSILIHLNAVIPDSVITMHKILKTQTRLSNRYPKMK